jgi:hypothetical protein
VLAELFVWAYNRPDPVKILTGIDEMLLEEVSLLHYDRDCANKFWLLHPAPDPSGLLAFSGDMQQGVPVEAVVAAIIGSAEYRADATLGV